MRLLEYEAKTILQAHSLPVGRSMLISPAIPLETVSLPTVLKSQVPIGGRGKHGGVVIVESLPELRTAVTKLLTRSIKGHTPTVLLAEEKLTIKKEFYLSLLIDRNDACIRLIAHTKGGIEVEENTIEDFLHLTLDTLSIADRAKQLAAYLHLPLPFITPLLTRLFEVFVSNDATLLEINPLILTQDDELMCGDCKMELDDAAAFRHADWNFEDRPQDTNFVVLNPNGTVATIANGAGLAMATVDAVALNGMIPANFLDIGGGANAKSVLQAFEKIITFHNVQAIVINIFAGITRCDEVAKAIIEAKEQITSLPPLFIRLAGTNFEAAVELLSQEKIATLATLEECLKAAKEASHAA